MSSGLPTDEEPPAGRRRWWWAPRSLRTRLLAEMVCLLAAVCVTVSLVTGAIMYRLQVARIDQELRSTSARVVSFDKTAGHIPLTTAPGVPAQTVLARVTGAGVTDAGWRDRATAAKRDLTARQLTALRNLPLDRPVTRHLAGLGDYRLIATGAAGGDIVITGLPLRPLYTAERWLLGIDVGVALISLVVATVLGGLVIRRTLRPLENIAATARRVTGLPLDRGEDALAVRVPYEDPRTEVGQVGTTLNRMLGRLADALAARRAVEERLRQFSADASHELRTPLAAIRGYTELIRRRTDLPPDVAHAMDRIESETARMTTLVDDLLRLARLDTDRPPVTAPVDLSWLIADSISDARAAGPDHVWRLDLPAEPVTVRGDEALLRRALTNLLSNGRVHTPAGTTVAVSLTASREQAVVTVVDDGPGIPDGLLPHVFERFTRGDVSRRHTAGTSGLGLAIAKAVVDAHGGRIEVTSRPGRTAFTVRLPVQASRPRR
ncbi:sensor histidine kinase [Dactylosporangium sp. NPDC048998]|uniref:sensor histidine kinase n=1 Tax=Dactylosporangium sp. NPDC048998 TaxID=3363976 RepID=UPI00371533D0